MEIFSEKNPEDRQDSTETNGTDNNGHLLISFLEERVQDLQAQREKSEQWETQLIEERGELLDLLKAEKEEKKEICALMLPPEDKAENEAVERNGHRAWWEKLIGT